MDDKVKKSWKTFLTPEVMRRNLIIASLYIAAFEILKDCIIGRIRDFFTYGFNQDGDIVSDEYMLQVLSKNKSPLYASLAWLFEHGVINEADWQVFDSIKLMRNELAHKLIGLLNREISNDVMAYFHKLAELLYKIEIWWIKEVEIPTSPDIVGKIDHDGIIPGSVITLRLMIDIALGSKEESEFYLKEFIKETS